MSDGAVTSHKLPFYLRLPAAGPSSGSPVGSPDGLDTQPGVEDGFAPSQTPNPYMRGSSTHPGHGLGRTAKRETSVRGDNPDPTQDMFDQYGPMAMFMLTMFQMTTAMMELVGQLGGGAPPASSPSPWDSSAEQADSVSDYNAQPELMQDYETDSHGNPIPPATPPPGATNTSGIDDGTYAGPGSQGITYKPVDGSLWGSGTPSSGTGGGTLGLGADFQQTGYAGDCYFMSSMASLALSDPNSVQSMIRHAPDGNPNDYQVRFYYHGKEEWVDVNNELPVAPDGQGGYAGLPKDANGQPIIGPALIEKAWAKFNDEHHIISHDDGGADMAGYNGIGNGGLGPEALAAITGKQITTVGDTTDPQSLTQQGIDPSQVETILQDANPPNSTPVTAGSVTPPDGSTTLPGGIFAGHEYSVLGTYTDANGQTMVTLRNPWGTNTPGGDDGTNGVISISLTQFMQDFQSVNTTGQPPPGTPPATTTSRQGVNERALQTMLRTQGLRA